MPTDQPYHHGDLRRVLVEAGLQLVAECGADGFTLREVARRSGVSHNAPYRHFASREDLLTAIAADGFERMAASIRRFAARGESPLDRLIEGIVAYLRFAAAHPAHYQVMFGSMPQTQSDSVAGSASSAFRLLSDAIAECQAAGAIKAGDPTEHARVAWSLLHGIATLHNKGQLRETRRGSIAQFGRKAISILLYGLGQ